MFIQKRRIVAEDEIDTNVENIDTEMSEEGMDDTVIAPEATDLLFEAEDVAELVAEVTGEPVEVTADDTVVTFAIGEDEYVVEAEGDEEILESSTKVLRGKRAVSASTNRRPARKYSRTDASISASAGKTIRKVPSWSR